MIKVFDNLCALSKAGADFLVSLVQAGLKANGSYSVCLTGGTTPERMYELLGSDPYVRAADWSRVHFWWGDDRYVPQTNDRSNEGMARRAWLSHIQCPHENAHPMYRGRGAEQDANLYEAELRTAFGERGCFDLVLMGLGDDGHTASLFPGDEASWRSAKWVLPTKSPTQEQRITLTTESLKRCKEMLFLVSGSDKANIIPAVFEHPLSFPSGFVAEAHGSARWFLDQNAATRLDLNRFGK